MNSVGLVPISHFYHTHANDRILQMTPKGCRWKLYLWRKCSTLLLQATEPAKFNLHQVFEKEVVEELFDEIFDEGLEYEMSEELIQRNEFLSNRYAHAFRRRQK